MIYRNQKMKRTEKDAPMIKNIVQYKWRQQNIEIIKNI